MSTGTEVRSVTICLFGNSKELGGGDLRLGLGLAGSCMMSCRGQLPSGGGEGKELLWLGTGPGGRLAEPEYTIDDASPRGGSDWLNNSEPTSPMSLGNVGTGFTNDRTIGAAAEGGRGMASGRFDG